jgi:hypothetical protein
MRALKKDPWTLSNYMKGLLLSVGKRGDDLRKTILSFRGRLAINRADLELCSVGRAHGRTVLGEIGFSKTLKSHEL